MTTRLFTFYGTIILQDSVWPVSVEVDITANNVAEAKAQMLLEVGRLKAVGINPTPYPPSSSRGEGQSTPRPQAMPAAVAPNVGPPVCPEHGLSMNESRVQKRMNQTAYYCSQQLDDGSYCLQRGSVTADGKIKTWEAKPR